MIGLILADIAGEPLEDGSYRGRDRELFDEDSGGYSDNTIMSCAIAEALMNIKVNASSGDIRAKVFASLEKYWNGEIGFDYNGSFDVWLRDPETKKEREGAVSWVSAAGWLYYSIDKVREAAWASAEAMHLSSDEVWDAEALACAVYNARIGLPSVLISRALWQDFDIEIPKYEKVKELKDIKDGPFTPLMEALACVFAALDFEGALRNALALQGDISTVIALTGAVAEAYFGIPEDLTRDGLSYIGDDLRKVADRFRDITRGFRYDGKKTADMFAGTSIIKECCLFAGTLEKHEGFYRVMSVIRDRMYQGGMFLVPYGGDINDRETFELRTLDAEDGALLVCFTSEDECKKGPETNAITIGIDTVLDMIQKHEEIGGIVINPFSDSIHITKAGARNILTERKTEL